MKNQSKLNNVKELHGDRQSIKLYSEDCNWRVYILAATSWLYECCITKIGGESNESLFNRAMEEIFATSIDNVYRYDYCEYPQDS